MKKYIVITGASSGIGAAAAKAFARRGENLILIARRAEMLQSLKDEIAKISPEPDVVVKICDLARSENVLALWDELKSYELKALINNAGFGDYGAVGERDLSKISQMLELNVISLTLLSHLFVRDYKYKPAQLINISSVTARCPAPRAAAYGAAKAGLLRFGESIFEEGRKAGLRVSTILPDMTKSGLYRNADFTVSEEPLAHLLPEDVADALEFILTRREGVCISELVLKPQLKGIRKKTG